MAIFKKKGKLIKKIFNKKNALGIVVLSLLLVQFYQVNSMSSKMAYLQDRDSSLIDEIGQVKESYNNFGESINEVRNFLRMPTAEYSALSGPVDEASEGNSEKNGDKVQLALFKYVSHLAVNENLAADIALQRGYMENMIEAEKFQTFLEAEELVVNDLVEDDFSVTLKIDNKQGDNIALYYLSKGDAALFLKTVTTKEEVTYENDDEFQKATMDFVKLNKADIEETLKSIKAEKGNIGEAIASEDVQAILDAKRMNLSDEYREENLKIYYEIKNSADELLAEIVLDEVALTVGITNHAGGQDMAGVTIVDALPTFLEQLDGGTSIEKKVNDALATIISTINDDGFKLLLSENELTVLDEPREDEDRYYFDLSDVDGNVLSSIVLEKATAVINIVDPQGTNSENLLFFDPEFKKKTLDLPDDIPDYGDELSHKDDTFNILIAGKHGNLIDTMIFAHVNETQGTMRMVSIPRDLHYNGRKINSFAFYYGMPELKRVLSDMTGYELDKYILIDMYAFIDVIDLIGGIDITLENAVIDPTYRTEDNGVVGTLYYEPGDYHLGGKESLRLARSRHTSSDFARAARQQLILESLQNKTKNFGFGDADTIYEIAKTVLSKTETDIGIDDAMVYYFKYQNYSIESNAVMSSGNVLFVPPYITMENCQGAIAAAEAAGQPRPGCEGENHAYTLVPRNGDWNIVKWFFKENFEALVETQEV